MFGPAGRAGPRAMAVQGILCRALAGGDGLSAVGGRLGDGAGQGAKPLRQLRCQLPFQGSLGWVRRLGGGAEGFCVLISTMQAGWRPPGAIFFLLRRRKNMERKTPLRAGGPALRTHPWYGVGTTAAHCTGCQAGLQAHPSPIPGEQTACRFAVAYALRL